MRGKKSNLCKNFGEEGTPENMSQFLLRSNRTYLKLFESENQLIISVSAICKVFDRDACWTKEWTGKMI